MNGGKGIYVGGTLISILISLALYFSGKRETAIFVGLWAPTILNLGQTLIDERLGSQKDRSLASLLFPYSPECVEGGFYALRLETV